MGEATDVGEPESRISPTTKVAHIDLIDLGSKTMKYVFSYLLTDE